MFACLFASPQQEPPPSVWAKEYELRAETRLHRAAKPLTKRRIEQAVKRDSSDGDAYATVSQLEGKPGHYILSTAVAFASSCTFEINPNGDLTRIALDIRGESSLVDAAQWDRGHYLLGGLLYWYGNAPRYEVSILSRTKTGCVRTSAAHTEHETWGADLPKHLLRGGRFSVTTRTYPANMDASHATALLGCDEQFEVRDFVVRRTGSVLRNTAYNALDRLAGALKRGDHAMVARIVPNARHRRILAKGWKQLDDAPHVSPVGHVSSVSGTAFTWGPWDKPRLTFKLRKRNGAWVVVDLR